MADWRLLWLMVLKESRTTMRERAQVRGLLVSVVIILLVMSDAMYHTNRATQRIHAFPTTIVRPVPSAQQDVITRWIVIGACAGIGFFFSMGYLMSAVLACFVGEKEARTLEILLASPLSDEKLFSLKAISVLLPSACIGSIFAVGLVIVAKIFIPDQTIHFPAMIVFYGPPLGILAMVLVQTCFVGLGAAISAKAETMKGAGQTLGVAFTIIVFGGGYGVPLLVRTFPALQEPLSAAIKNWLALPFGRQYGMVLLALGIPAAILLGIGRAFFRRDRMLT